MSVARPTETNDRELVRWQEDYQSPHQVIVNDTCLIQVSRGPALVHRALLPELGGIPKDLQVKTTPLFQLLCETWA